MIKKIVEQEDLDNNPDLVTQGVKVGDEIEIPETAEETEAPKNDGTAD
jgi:hypothetical protein